MSSLFSMGYSPTQTPEEPIFIYFLDLFSDYLAIGIPTFEAPVRIVVCAERPRKLSALVLQTQLTNDKRMPALQTVGAPHSVGPIADTLNHQLRRDATASKLLVDAAACATPRAQRS